MIRRLKTCWIVFALGFSSSAATAAEPIEGVWRTDDGKGLVRIAPCGSAMCGRIVRVLDTGPDVPRTDVNNPEPGLRGRSIVGLVTLTGFSRAGSSWGGGRAYDPKSGRTYRASMEVERNGALKLTGCLLFICQSRRWTRVE